MLVFAHRGESAHHPENSRTAIQACADIEIDGIELDIYQVGQQFVVFHDRWLTRELGMQKRILQLTEDELTNLIGRDGLPLPTLEWVMSTLANSTLTLNLELKFIAKMKDFTLELKRLCNRYAVSFDRLLVSSFNHKDLQDFHSHLPDVKLGLLIAHHPIALTQVLPGFPLFSIHLDMSCLSASLIAECRALGLEVYIFTVDHEDELSWLYEHNASGVFANDPRHAQQFIASLTFTKP